MKHRSIAQLVKHDRPREKLNDKGVDALSTPELIALLIGSGHETANALTVAKQLSRSFPSLQALSAATLSQLMQTKGIGPVKASRLLACFALAERLYQQPASKALLTAADVLAELTFLTTSDREQLVVLYCDARYRLIKQTTVAIGSLNVIHALPRDILSEALTLPCLGIFLAHNHPSGDPSPSPEDQELTQRVDQACQLMGLTLIDHLIVTRQDHYSFRESGQL